MRVPECAMGRSAGEQKRRVSRQDREIPRLSSSPRPTVLHEARGLHIVEHLPTFVIVLIEVNQKTRLFDLQLFRQRLTSPPKPRQRLALQKGSKGVEGRTLPRSLPEVTRLGTTPSPR